MDILNNNFLFNKEANQTMAEAEQTKAEALLALANKPATKTSPLVFIIPVAAMVTLGIVVFLIKKRK